jgi:hypothetical protein
MSHSHDEQANRHSLPWLAWLLFGITLASIIATLVILIAGCSNIVISGTPIDRMTSFVLIVSNFLFATLGLAILYRRPGHNIGWLCLVIGAFNINAMALVYSECSTMHLPAADYMTWITYWGFPASLLVLFVLLPMLFPDGHFLSRRWRTFTVVGCALFTLILFLTAFLPGPMVMNGMDLGDPNTPENPLALSFIPTSIGPILNASISIVLLVMSFVAIASLVVRYRRSEGETRQQLKWFAYFLAVVVSTQLIAFELVGAFFYPDIFDSVAYALIVAIVFIGFPVVIGITVLRYRLYDIDIIIRRTLIYALVTATLVLIYLGSVVLLQQLFGRVTGQQSTLAIVLSTLLIAALFNPLRRRTQRLIEHRFYRRRYNAERVLERFAAASRNEVDLGALEVELAAVVRETMLPTSVSIWINRPRE